MNIDIEEASVILIKKKCSKCGNIRKFVKGTPRDKQNICGNCWDWTNEPSYLKVTPAELEKLKKLIAED